jgi:hypothetical protein
MANNHHAHVYRTWEEFSKVWIPKAQRWARRIWNEDVAKHGNVPYITKCSVCSGREQDHEVRRKYGNKRGFHRPTKVERDELLSPEG